MKHESSKGTLLALGAYTLWGILPLYWKTLASIDPSLVLAHRIVWALVAVAVVLFVSRGFKEIKSIFANPRRLALQAIAAMLIAGNWWLYIWAVNNGHVIDSAMGYYINPLVSVILGIIFLKERLRLPQVFAFSLAAAGVLYMAIDLGRPPWVALGLALSFGFYGLIKKKSQLSSFGSLQIETLMSLPLAGFLFAQAWANNPDSLGASMANPSLTILVLLSGPITIIPLWLFGSAAKLIPLSRIGFIQYLSPSLNLLIGVVVFHETFSNTQVIAFTAIWTALLIYSVHSFRSQRRLPVKY